MEPITIYSCRFSELSNDPEFPSLVREYSDECALVGMPRPVPNIPQYLQLEEAGILQAFAVRHGDILAGLAVVLTNIIPHYSAPMSVTESIVLRKGFRKGSAGRGLIRMVEQFAADVGAFGLLVSCPIGGRMMDLMPLIGFSETNRVFFKAIPQ